MTMVVIGIIEIMAIGDDGDPRHGGDAGEDGDGLTESTYGLVPVEVE